MAKEERKGMKCAEATHAIASEQVKGAGRRVCVVGREAVLQATPLDGQRFNQLLRMLPSKPPFLGVAQVRNFATMSDE